MTRTLLLCAVLAAAPLGGCAEAPPGGGTAAARGKTAAPVAIEGRLLDGKAELTFRFAAPASGVDITVSGVDGLTVTSAPALVRDGTFARGETRRYAVDYTAGDARASLAVAVRGVFAGQARARIVTFPARRPEVVEQPATGAADVAGEERVKALPADPGTTR